MKPKQEYDALLIGAGIMSTTLATLLKELKPSWNIHVLEKLGATSLESSGALNNAGTGHSGFCEMNYDLHKAITVCEAFEKSKQFWSYLVKKEYIQPDFIHRVPHISFVEGRENVDQLKKRWQEMKEVCLFADMEFSDDPKVLKEWIPLVMSKRDDSIPVAATRIKRGVDIDFGLLTKNLTDHLVKQNVFVAYHQKVTNIKKKDGRWIVTIHDTAVGDTYQLSTKFLFVGSGGMALNLLEKTGIPEAKGYGGFPVSGQFLMCDNEYVVKKHHAKVYGKPELGAPPMSTPHLDARIINGTKVLLFGPYAGFTTKFLKSGHWFDFFGSLRLSNVFTILSAGLRNLGLSKYLLKEVTKNHEARFKTLLKYYPTADINDWKLIKAGQRVQVIKKDMGIPTIEFGTEIVSSKDGSIAALLGASPGASTSVSTMIDVIEKCFTEDGLPAAWTWKVGEFIPSNDTYLHKDKDFFEEIEKETSEVLGLTKEMAK